MNYWLLRYVCCKPLIRPKDASIYIPKRSMYGIPLPLSTYIWGKCSYINTPYIQCLAVLLMLVKKGESKCILGIYIVLMYFILITCGILKLFCLFYAWKKFQANSLNWWFDGDLSWYNSTIRKKITWNKSKSRLFLGAGRSRSLKSWLIHLFRGSFYLGYLP